MRWCARFSPRDADGGALLLALLLAVAFAAGLTPASARAATSPEYYGTNLQSLGVAPPGRWGLFIDQLAAGQMDVARLEVRWNAIEPTPPVGDVHAFQWAGADALVSLLATRGVRVAPLFRFSPAWAQGAGSELPPSSYDDFGRFVAGFAARYGPAGTFWAQNPRLPRHPTLTYEIWNEPNLDQYAWSGKADPVAYAGLLKVVRPILKAAQPSAIMMGTLAWQTDGPGVAPDFVARLAAAGGLNQIDAMGYHPYAPDAQSTLDLVIGLRARLAAAGQPSMPIYANESGQPVVLSGPGAQYGYAGRPSDGARAASVTFAGDALAASDCSVEQFMLYSISGSEREFEDGGEPIGEGFMGMLDKDDASPNLTGQALQRASLRWVARSSSDLFRAAPLAICGGGLSPPGSLLPIQITVTGAEPGCARINARYDGNPLESAMLRFSGLDGRPLAQARTDAFGDAQQCVPLSRRAQPFEVLADLPNAGISPIVVCDVPDVGCPSGSAITPTSGRLSAAAALAHPSALLSAGTRASGPCTWKLTAAQVGFRAGRSVKRSRARMLVAASCETAPVDRKVRFVLIAKAARSKVERKIRVLWLQNKVQRTLTVNGQLRRGDKLVMLHQEEPAMKIPRMRAVVPFGLRPSAG